MPIKTFELSLPTHWASYLINGDASSFSLYDDGDDEIARIDALINDCGGYCIDVSEESEFRHASYDAPGELANDYATYTFIEN